MSLQTLGQGIVHLLEGFQTDRHTLAPCVNGGAQFVLWCFGDFLMVAIITPINLINNFISPLTFPNTIIQPNNNGVTNNTTNITNLPAALIGLLKN